MAVKVKTNEDGKQLVKFCKTFKGGMRIFDTDYSDDFAYNKWRKK